MKTTGIILHKIEYGENDVIFDILNEEGKRLSFFARGAKKMKNKFHGILQLGVVVNIVYAEGRNLAYPSEILLENEHYFDFYLKSFTGMKFFLDVIGTLKALTKDLEDSELFEITLNTLHEAQTHPKEDLDEIYVAFFKEILSVISVECELVCGQSNTQILAPEFYYHEGLNKVYSSECSSIITSKSQKIEYSTQFYKKYLQRLCQEHISKKLHLQF